MPVRLNPVRSFLSFFLLLGWANPCVTQAVAANPAAVTPVQAQALVERAVAA